nr:MAG TPA: hypothetical protein [Caudoviricetes sp.]
MDYGTCIHLRLGYRSTHLRITERSRVVSR